MYTIIQSDDKYIYNSLSIETVLPSGIIQHITSFNNLSNIKAMSKILINVIKKINKEREKQFVPEINKINQMKHGYCS